MKRLLSLLLALVMVVSMLPTNVLALTTTPDTVTVDEARERLDALIELFEGKFFTVNQKYCTIGSHSNDCSNCLMSSVVSKSWCRNLVGMGTLYPSNYPAQYNYDGSKWSVDGYQCYGFANFAHWYIFAKNNTDNLVSTLVKTGSLTYNTMKYARPGDVLRFSTSWTSGHSAIFVSCDSSGFTVLDCNHKDNVTGQYACEVKLHKLSYQSGGKVAITGVKNYDRALTYVEKCKEYPSYMSLEITKPTTLKKYPCSASTDATSTNIYTPKIGDTFTSYALWKNTKGNYWYEVKDPNGTTCYLYAGDAEWTNNGFWNDFSTSNIVAPTRLTRGESFYIGGTVKSKYNEITRVRAYVYKGNATSGTPVLSSSSEIVAGNSYNLKNSKVDAGLLFSSLPAGDYTYVLKVYVDRNNCSRGTNFLRYYNTVKVYSKPFCVGEQVSYLDAPVASVDNRASDGKPRVTWEPVDGAVEYKVYRSTSKNGTYSLKFTTSGTSYINTDAKTGESYYYKVRAVDEYANYSSYSNYVYRTCDCAQPVVTVSNVASSGKVKLTWKAVSGATKYEVYRAASENGTYTKLGTTTGTVFTNTSAVAGQTYYYKVRALGSFSEATSAYSTVKSRTCDYAAPTVTVTNTSNGKPKVTWTDVAGATKYEVYRATSKNGTYHKMYTTTGNGYINTSAVAGKGYYYKVRAVGVTSDATSAYSPAIYRVCDYAAPTVTVSNNSYGKPRLTWEAVSGATKYKVAYSTSRNGVYYWLGSTSGNAFTNTSAVKGKTYYYKVRAVGPVSAADSAFSPVVYRTCR